MTSLAPPTQKPAPAVPLASVLALPGMSSTEQIPVADAARLADIYARAWADTAAQLHQLAAEAEGGQ